jgi:putative transposase
MLPTRYPRKLILSYYALTPPTTILNNHIGVFITIQPHCNPSPPPQIPVGGLTSGNERMWYSLLMPGRNIVKIDLSDTFYHVYARGVGKQTIFAEESDFIFFLWLLKRYLSYEKVTNKDGLPYSKHHDDISLVTYCLMSNHFHLLLYQINAGGMQQLMRRVMASYSRYFNKKYDRTGHLFETTYRASRISNDKYLLHISRYIHLNPPGWQTYPHSSIDNYVGKRRSDWVVPGKILALFSSKTEYLSFIKDYKPTSDELAEIKHELANE